jgi:hypothetical protein
MKRIIESEELSGLEALIGETVLLMCANYFYTGKLTGVNETCVTLESPAIVYETGEWSSKQYNNVQKLHTTKWYVRINAIESFGISK